MCLPNPLPGLASHVEQLEAQHMLAYAAAGEGMILETAGSLRTLYCGPDLPINVGFGVGDGPDGLSDLPLVEDFLTARGVTSSVVAHSHLHPEAMAAFAARRYTLTRVLHIHIRDLTRPVLTPDLPAQRADAEEWLRTVVPAFGKESQAIMTLTARRPSSTFWVWTQGGKPVAAGALSVFGDLALLYSAATLPEARGQGGQTALLAARLTKAQAEGATHAVVMTAPGSASERNISRAGFLPLVSRLSFVRSGD